MKPLLVAGFGNPLMADEGIGIKLVAHFFERESQYPHVEFADVGTAGSSLIHWIAGRRKVIILDCARMGLEPGTLKRFSPDQVRSKKSLMRQSLHEGDILQTLELSRFMGECPGEVVIFGIEPKLVEMGMDLSPELAGRFDDYVKVLELELSKP